MLLQTYAWILFATSNSILMSTLTVTLLPYHYFMITLTWWYSYRSVRFRRGEVWERFAKVRFMNILKTACCHIIRTNRWNGNSSDRSEIHDVRLWFNSGILHRNHFQARPQYADLDVGVGSQNLVQIKKFTSDIFSTNREFGAVASDAASSQGVLRLETAFKFRNYLDFSFRKGLDTS